MLKYTLNQKQYDALSGLAYWVSNETITRRYFPEDVHEIKKCHDTICNCIFPECDALKIPFWVQNSVVAIGEDFKSYKSLYFITLLNNKNIFLEV